MNQLDIKARVLLTGTPIQNDLQEFYALVHFVNPGILGSAIGRYRTLYRSICLILNPLSKGSLYTSSSEFRRKFEEPIVASRQPSCSPEEQVLGEERALELNSRTSCFILRRTQAVINQYLPTKTEVVVFIKPVSIQVKNFYLNASLDEKKQQLHYIFIKTKFVTFVCAFRGPCAVPPWTGGKIGTLLPAVVRVCVI